MIALRILIKSLWRNLFNMLYFKECEDLGSSFVLVSNDNGVIGRLYISDVDKDVFFKYDEDGDILFIDDMEDLYSFSRKLKERGFINGRLC